MGSENIDNYNIILLKHIDRLSALSVIVQGDVLKDGNIVLQHREEDKKIAFAWGVSFLNGMIPDGMKDDEFKGYISETLQKVENKEGFNYNMSLFVALINLLNRQGLLMVQSVTGYVGDTYDELEGEA